MSYLFFSNSDDSLDSRACVTIYKRNCNPKSNLILDHSKYHILPVSVKPASVSNFCVSSTISSSSFANSASKRSFYHSKFSSPNIPATPKSPISISLTDRNNCSFRFLRSLNLMIQNLLVRLLKHLIVRLFQ